MREMLADAASGVEPEDYIEIKTRTLEFSECHELHKWLLKLPGTSWSDEDADNALTHLLTSQQALVTLPAHMTSEAIYCKVKWG